MRPLSETGEFELAQKGQLYGGFKKNFAAQWVGKCFDKAPFLAVWLGKVNVRMAEVANNV